MKTAIVRHLTHDETLEMDSTTVRIRIWQGANATPIVLVTGMERECSSDRKTSKIANYVNEAILRHPSFGMLYFMSTPLGSVSQVHFEYLGHCNRLKFFSPSYIKKGWEAIERIVGEPIQR